MSTAAHRRKRTAMCGAALATFSALAPGCQTWQAQPVPRPAPGTARRLPDPVRVTSADLTVRELRHAQVARDSLVGYARSTGMSDSVRVALAIAEVRRIEAPGRTAGTAIGVFFGALLALLIGAGIATGV